MSESEAAWIYNEVAELNAAQHESWLALLEKRTGIDLGRHRSILQLALSRRMRAVGCHSYDDYYDYISSGVTGELEWAALLNEVTVKETSFFRDPDAARFVERFIDQRLQHHLDQLGNSLEIWSAGCSTGEEPFSLAMIADACMARAELKLNYGVTASDISRSALNYARRGLYRKSRSRAENIGVYLRYLRHPNEHEYAVDDAIKARVCFVQGNLMEIQEMRVTMMDLIYCQNVLIYFRRDKQHHVLNQLTEKLKPGGLLVIGHGEGTDWLNNKVKRVHSNKVQAYIRTNAT